MINTLDYLESRKRMPNSMNDGGVELISMDGVRCSAIPSRRIPLSQQCRRSVRWGINTETKECAGLGYTFRVEAADWSGGGEEEGCANGKLEKQHPQTIDFCDANYENRFRFFVSLTLA